MYEIYEMIRTVMEKSRKIKQENHQKSEVKKKWLDNEKLVEVHNQSRYPRWNQKSNCLRWTRFQVDEFFLELSKGKKVKRAKLKMLIIRRKMWVELKEANRCLHESVINLKSSSMRDNLLFFNVEEEEK